ncbi:DNA replication protein psf2 [Coemansia sp. RSA 455]|nr:DNA replication protein psf2 [Coemansia sp. RSA 455]
MAITTRQKEGFTMPELEYLAQNEAITIVPLHRMDRIELVRGTIGPFRPPQKTVVPLWVAIMLKRTNRCRIVAPKWMQYEHLRELNKREEQPDAMFTRLPTYYLEIAHMLLTFAEDDLVESQGIRRLLQDLREVRQSKTMEGLRMLNSLQLQMDNLSMAEINEIRPLFGHSFDMLRQLDGLAQATETEQQQSQFADQSYAEMDDAFGSRYFENTTSDSSTIIGWLKGSADNSAATTDGAKITPAQFVENREFWPHVEYVFREHAHEDPELQAQAAYQKSGWMNITDGRNPPPLGRTGEPEDIVGCVLVEDKCIKRGSFQPNPTHRPASIHGLFQLPKYLQAKLLDHLATIGK